MRTPERRVRSLKRQFTTLCLGLLGPTLVFVGVLLWQFAASERHRIEAEARALSSGVAVALDREINGVLTTLQALATSPSLQAGDLPAFYAQAGEIRRLQGIHISLRSVDGHTVLTTRAPLGAAVAVPLLLAATDREILRADRATVSDVFTSTTSKRPVFQIVAAPVRVGGAPTYLLAASIDLDYLVEAIRREGLPPGWVGALVDRSGVIAVRTESHEAFAGTPASADFRARAVGAAGSYYGRGSDGRDLLAGYARSELTGWTATASVGTSVVEAPLRRSLLILVALGLVLGLIATAIALLVGRRVERAVRRLSEAALAIGRGEPVAPVATGVLEVNQVGRALAAAADQLRERARERDRAQEAERRLNAVLAEQAADLRESNEEMQRYAYIVSHDLRAPLVNVMGFTSELEAARGEIRAALGQHPQAEVIDRDVGEALSFIQAAVTKMEGLIAAILKLSREGRRALRPEPLAMPDLVRGLADAIRHQTESADAVIEVAPDLPGLTADRLAVEQVFGNLLDNAVKYLAAGRPGRIAVTGEVRGPSVAYEVRDNGRGIAPQDQARVFELFRRAGVQDRPGEGIGLAQVRATVKALGGRVALASRAGEGTTFTVVLPRAGAVPALQAIG